MGCGVWGQIQETTSAATVTHGMVHRPCAHRGQDRCDGSDPQGLLPALESFLPGEACCIPGEVAATRTRRSLLGMHRDRSEEHTSELQSPCNLVCRLLLEKKDKR